MQLSCLQENLRSGLAAVGRAATSKSTLPVLSHVLLATDEGRLKLAATNLEIGITTWVGAKVTAEGAVTVPAKLLADVANGFSNDVVDLSVDIRTQTLHLRCAGSAVAIKGIAADEFPSFPAYSQRPSNVTFAPDLLCEAIDQVARAAATDDTRPALAGVSMRIQGTTATFTTSDGFRLAQRTMMLAQPASEAYDVIVPARALIELARSLANTTSPVAVTLTPSEAQIVFQTDDLEMISRLIDGKYPDITRIIPRDCVTRAVLDRQAVVRAVKLAACFAPAATNVVKLDLAPGGDHTSGTLTISASAAEVGDYQTVREGAIAGAGGQILLNIAYVADAIHAIATPQLTLEIQTAQHPAVFKPVGVNDFISVIMPMHVR